MQSTKKRVVLNTAFSYMRSVFAMLVGLFTARWVLQALGESDYGLFGVVGSIMVFVTFLNGVLAGAVSRYFAFCIGKANNEDELNKWFNAALIIHTTVPLVLLVVGLLLGTFIIQTILYIEEGKIGIATVVFYICCVSSAFSMMAAPFNSMLYARQNIVEQSIIGFGETFVHFISMYILMAYIKNNTLIVYTVFLASKTILFQIILSLRTMSLYKELRFRIYPRRVLMPYIRELLVFSSWKSLMGFGKILYTQGSAIVLNIFFGTRLNAAYSIGTNISAQAGSLSSSLMTAITPEIVSREGGGNHESMKSLSYKASKYSSILICFIALPLISDIQNLLVLWLKTPPSYTTQFCIAIVISLIIEKLASGHESALNANGKIAGFQASIGINFILSVLITYILFRIYESPLMLCAAILLSQMLSLLIKLYWGKRMVDLSIRNWVIHSVIPVVGCVLVYFSLFVLYNGLLPESGMIRLVVVTVLSSMIICLYSWFFILEKSIKDGIITRVKYLSKRFKND
jgi:O-antigen/teichoic acid export membrane protein